jgi:phage terminase small subunit
MKPGGKAARVATRAGRGLTIREQRFCEEYLTDLNASEAAKRAGYSPKGASAAGARLLGRVRVGDRIQELRAEQSRRTLVTADRVILELARVAFSDIRCVYSWGPEGVQLKPSAALDDEAAAAIAEVTESRSAEGGVTRRVKLHDKVSALEKLGRHFDLFKGAGEVNARVNIVIDLVPAYAAAPEAASAPPKTVH